MHLCEGGVVGGGKRMGSEPLRRLQVAEEEKGRWMIRRPAAGIKGSVFLKWHDPVTVLPVFPNSHARPHTRARACARTHATLYINISSTCARETHAHHCALHVFALFPNKNKKKRKEKRRRDPLGRQVSATLIEGRGQEEAEVRGWGHAWLTVLSCVGFLFFSFFANLGSASATSPGVFLRTKTRRKIQQNTFGFFFFLKR